MKYEAGLVSVVIINFNSAAHIERCLQAIEEQTYPRIEILVIDNGSSDGSLITLQHMANMGSITLFTGENVGSSKANNIGIRESKGEYVLILNADAFPLPGYIEKCVAGFRKGDHVGTVIGKLVSDTNISIIDSTGIYIYREGVAVDRGQGEIDRGQYDKEEIVDGACCAAAMYCRPMLDDIRIGGEYYDEDFFAFLEDVDLSFHAALRGWRTFYIPSAIARHVRGGSSGTMSEFTCYLHERNTLLFFRKGFILVARPLDKVLLFTVLLARRIIHHKRLTSNARARLKKDVVILGKKMDKKRNLMQSLDSVSSFTMTGRRSYLVAIVRRMVGLHAA